MAEYVLRVSSSAQHELDALDESIFARIDRKILGLAQNPRPAGCKKLAGFRDHWRIRVGDWRVIYVIRDKDAEVTITRVAHRREVYD